MQARIGPVVTAMRSDLAGVVVRYPVQTRREAWVLPEGTVPESIPHDAVAHRLKVLLEVWASRLARPCTIARNLAIHWLETSPRVGIDPDVCVLDPSPPGVNDLPSLCLWKAGHSPPTICFEVVSRNHPHKDYAELQDRYALVGTRELVVFDPFLAGPSALGGPVLLQLWRRDRVGVLERVHAGDTPAPSEVLGAWLIPTTTTLEIADDREGTRRFMTWEELASAKEAETQRERAEKERERAEKERERAARLELERRIAEIEAKVGGRG
jgi:hypothetical protein